MTRQTSINAYREIERNGLLSKRRWQVYSYVFHNGPLTAKAVWRELAPNSNSGVITTRFSELQRQGVMQEVGQIEDVDSGMSAILWDVTDRIPQKLEKSKTQTRKELQTRYDVYRDVLVTIWKDKRTPTWVKDIIRQKTKHLKKT